MATKTQTKKTTKKTSNKAKSTKAKASKAKAKIEKVIKVPAEELRCIARIQKVNTAETELEAMKADKSVYHAEIIAAEDAIKAEKADIKKTALPILSIDECEVYCEKAKALEYGFNSNIDSAVSIIGSLGLRKVKGQLRCKGRRSTPKTRKLFRDVVEAEEKAQNTDAEIKATAKQVENCKRINDKKVRMLKKTDAETGISGDVLVKYSI